MNLPEIVKRLKPIKGQRLSQWLERFLVAPPENLAKWSGMFTEVITAKVVGIYRKRGLIEEHEANDALFRRFVNATYRAPVLVLAPPVGGQAQAPPPPTNPFEGCDSDLDFIQIGKGKPKGTSVSHCGDCWCWGGNAGKTSTRKLAEALGVCAEGIVSALSDYFRVH